FDAAGRRRERRGGVSFLARLDAGLLGELRELRPDAVRVERGALPFVPLDLEGPPPLVSLPVAIRHHGDPRGAARRADALPPRPRARLERDDVPDARHGPGSLGVEALHLAAEHRAALDGG